MARYDAKQKLLILESKDRLGQIREIQALFPPLPQSFFNTKGSDFKLSLAAYRWSCLCSALPYLVDHDNAFKKALSNKEQGVKSFFEKLSGAGFEIQVVYRAFKDWFQFAQIKAESLGRFVELKAQDLPSVISSRSERSRIMRDFQDLVLSDRWREMSFSDRVEAERQRDSNLNSVTTTVGKILLYSSSHLPSAQRSSILISEESGDVLQDVLTTLINRELKKYYSDPSNYKLLPVLS